VKYLMLYDTSEASRAKAARHLSAHQARLEDFHRRGTLLMWGPLLDLQAGPSALGIFTTRQAAEDFVQGDPFVLNGVVTRWTIRDWQDFPVTDDQG
jgi:uncharacterized protein YciI